MIVGLVLPERQARAFQELIRPKSGRTFQPTRDLVYRDLWQNQQMDVVGHDYPRSEFVEASLLFADDDCFGYQASNAGLVQPSGAGGVSM